MSNKVKAYLDCYLEYARIFDKHEVGVKKYSYVSNVSFFLFHFKKFLCMLAGVDGHLEFEELTYISIGF